MAWIFDTYSMNVGHSVLGVVTGKPLSLGGSVGRDEATARGALYCIRTALQKQGGRLPDTRIAIQGFGNVGRNLARLLAEEGARVVAVSRLEGRRRRTRTGSTSPPRSRTRPSTALLNGLPGADEITNDELIELDCDVLAPCALEQVITGENAARVRARMICEGANGPTTPAADEILEDRGILVLPDVLANAGGVVVSYFEWVQGLQEYFWKEYEVNAKLNDIIVRAFEETWQTRERFAHDACAWRPTASPSSGSPRRRRSAASTRRTLAARSARPSVASRRVRRPTAATSARRRSRSSRTCRAELAVRARGRRHHRRRRSSRRAIASGSRSSRSTASAPSRYFVQRDALRDDSRASGA